MKMLTVVAAASVSLALTSLAPVGTSTVEAHRKRPQCSVRQLSGNWIFATDVGQFPSFGGDITAIGTMNIDPHGNLGGTFDATVAEVGFLPGNSYEGSIVVNDDCTGTVEFATSQGTLRVDSIAVISRDEIWGMSQFPENLWTYRARRIGSNR